MWTSRLKFVIFYDRLICSDSVVSAPVDSTECNWTDVIELLYSYSRSLHREFSILITLRSLSNICLNETLIYYDFFLCSRRGRLCVNDTARWCDDTDWRWVNSTSGLQWETDRLFRKRNIYKEIWSSLPSLSLTRVWTKASRSVIEFIILF